MSRTWKDRFGDDERQPGQYPQPRRWKAWQRVLKIAPQLKAMYRWHWIDEPPPRPMSDCAFVALAAAFTDPVKAEVLRALMFDLLYDDLKDLFVRHAERMHGWKPKLTLPRE